MKKIRTAVIGAGFMAVMIAIVLIAAPREKVAAS